MGEKSDWPAFATSHARRRRFVHKGNDDEDIPRVRGRELLPRYLLKTKTTKQNQHALPLKFFLTFFHQHQQD